MAITKKMAMEFLYLSGLPTWVGQSHPNFPHKKFQIYLELCEQLLNSGITPTKEMFVLVSVAMDGPDSQKIV